MALPIRILRARDRVHIKDTVKAVLLAPLYGPVEITQALFVKTERPVLKFNKAVIERDTHAIRAPALYYFDILFPDEGVPE